MANADPRPARFISHTFTVADGLRLSVRDYPGSAAEPPLLCLHGLTRNSRDFAGFAARYSPRFRVLALDFRGRGESDRDPVPTRYTPLTYARDVLELLDHLSIQRAVFVGTSLGGLVTMTVAALAPQRIAAAILNDVGPELSQEGLDRIKTYVGNDVRFASWDEAARALAATNRNLPATHSHVDWLSMAHRTCREEAGEICFDYDMAIAHPFDTKGAAPTIDLWPLFRALALKPLLVLRGEHSDLLGAEAFARMEQAAPDGLFVTVPGVPHPPDLNEPASLLAIDSFLSGLPPAG
jgi:pimeloyl-ACP methyl ester carboxylesterase